MTGAHDSANWAPDDLRRIGGAEEIGLASRRPDGSPRPYVTMWAVRAGCGLYVRSACGPHNPWYLHAAARVCDAPADGTRIGGPAATAHGRVGCPRRTNMTEVGL